MVTVADNRLAEAIDVVARWIIAFQALNVEWGDYPEIGEHDWGTVIDRLDELADSPGTDEYEAAYDFLAARADGEATP